MKLALIRSIVVIGIVLTLNSCRKDYVVSEGQEILFQQEYINNAWVFQHYGYIIDNNGNVLSFNKPANWHFPDEDNKLTETQVKENISSCSPTGKVIDKEELQKYVNHIDNISASKISALKNVGADMGSLTYYCYQFSGSSLTYKATKIKMEGDYQCENLNYYSKKVAAWMDGIRPALPEF